MSGINSEFTQAQIDHLCGLYVTQDLPLDSLPYTQQFQGIVAGFYSRWHTGTPHQIWTTLVKLRKRQLLPRKREATGQPQPALFS